MKSAHQTHREVVLKNKNELALKWANPLGVTVVLTRIHARTILSR